MNDFKPITEWTAAELIEAARERGTGMDPIFDEMLRRLEVTERAEPLILAGRTVEEWFEFAKRDDCLDQMVPSDLRAIISAIL